MYLQIIGFISFFLLATLLCFFRGKDNTNIWYAGYLYAISLGQIAYLIDPTPIKIVVIVHTFHFNEFMARFLSSLSYRFSPFFLLLIGFEISKIIPERKVKFIYLVSGIPILVEYVWDFIFPNEGFLCKYLDFTKNFYLLSCWATLYMLTSLVLIFYAYLKEKNLYLKRQNLLIFILTFPAIGLLYIAYITPLIKPFDYSSLHAVFGKVIFIIFLIISCNFGLLNVKIKLDRDISSNTISSMNLGTAVLCHAIKNKLTIINITSENIKNIESIEVKKFYTTFKNSIEQLNNLMGQIQSKTQIDALITKMESFTALINESLTIHKPLFEHENISYEFISEKIRHDTCECDKVLLLEVFSNIFFNSIEALKRQEFKKIQVKLICKYKYLYIIIRDNGPGISKENLPYVFNPFFSTKRSQSNFGLGLTYCFNVLQKHKGELKVETNDDEGTTVILKLPKVKPI